jgi:collagen type I/II/III/V/XI/XXIV/XXVII alpha
MAAVSWKTDASGNWSGGTTVWTPSVPTSADDVTIGFGTATNPAFIVTEDVASVTIKSLTIDGDTSGGVHSVTLALVGNTLTVSGALTLTNDQGIISGKGNLSVGGAITGNSGTIIGTGGVLDITGAGSLSGAVLTIGTGSASTLEIDLSGGATAAALALTSLNQTLEVGPSGSLTLTGGQTVSGSAQIVMAGGKLTDSSGISFATGTLSGFGTVAANMTRASGTDTITASGGTLDLTGTFASGLTASISSASASDLKFDNTATSSTAISITSANQTLEIGSSGALTISAAQNVTNGTIQMDGGSLTDTSNVTLGAGSHLTGFGTFNPAFAATNSGTVTATGGTLTLATALGANSGLVLDIGNSASSVLKLSAQPGTGNTFTFLGSAGDLALSSSTTFNDAVVGLNVGTSLTPTNFVDILGSVVTVTSGQSGTGASGTVKLSNGAQLNLSGITNSSGTWFVNTKTDGAGGTDVFVSTVCFAAGTRILTGTGERVVESLLAGDIVLTLSGGEFGASPVKWIGRRRIDLTAHPRPETIAPVRIRRGAFADNMPHTDLLVSPDHAVFVDGKLICARQLVNGTTILQEQGRTSVDYYHVELDAHAILLAEGLATESYLDTGNRSFFGNSDEALILHPDLTDESDYPAREAGSCAPFVSVEADVLPVWQRLADRASALGQPVPQLETTTDPAPHLFAKGRTVKPMYGENGLYIFALPKGATEVRLISRSAAPTDARPWLEDRRRLGLYVERIVLRGADAVHEVPVDHPGLTRGWWAVEPRGTAMRRWTDGNAVLPLPMMDGPTMLEIRATNAGLAFPVSADQVSAAA